MSKILFVLGLSFCLLACKEEGAKGAEKSSDGASGIAQGEKGPTGDRGPQGIAGADGAVGAKGPTGDKGASGDRGPNGGTAGEFWLARHDGSLIAQIVTFGTNFTLWSEADQVAVTYISANLRSPTKSFIVGANSVTLYYENLDCSDSPHIGVDSVTTIGSIGNTAFAIGTKVYKSLIPLSDTINVRAMTYQNGETINSCFPATGGNSGIKTLYRIQEIANFSLPLSLDMGTYKIIRR